MALGVDGMRAGKVIRKAIFLTLGTVIFIFCLTLVYQSMRAVMDVGGACASGGAYEIRQQCPKGVGWVMPVGIFGMFFAGIFTFLGVFNDGGPRPYVFAWSALFLALGWNFLDYGFDSPAPGGGAEVGWIICGVVFVLMGGVPLLALLSPKATRWALWGPDSQRADDYLHPYKPPPIRTKKKADAPVPDAPSTVHSSTPYARTASAPANWTPTPAPTDTVFVPHPTDVIDPPPDPPKPAKPANEKDVVERLQTLADLRQRGMLDEEEYERAKSAVLDEEGSA
jgi:Short C-terminal domain